MQLTVYFPHRSLLSFTRFIIWIPRTCWFKLLGLASRNEYLVPGSYSKYDATATEKIVHDTSVAVGEGACGSRTYRGKPKGKDGVRIEAAQNNSRTDSLSY